MHIWGWHFYHMLWYQLQSECRRGCSVLCYNLKHNIDVYVILMTDNSAASRFTLSTKYLCYVTCVRNVQCSIWNLELSTNNSWSYLTRNDNGKLLGSWRACHETSKPTLPKEFNTMLHNRFIKSLWFACQSFLSHDPLVTHYSVWYFAWTKKKIVACFRYSDVIMGTMAFTQPFIGVQIKENIKATRNGPLCGECVKGKC